MKLGRYDFPGLDLDEIDRLLQIDQAEIDGTVTLRDRIDGRRLLAKLNAAYKKEQAVQHETEDKS